MEMSKTDALHILWCIEIADTESTLEAKSIALAIRLARFGGAAPHHIDRLEREHSRRVEDETYWSNLTE